MVMIRAAAGALQAVEDDVDDLFEEDDLAPSDEKAAACPGNADTAGCVTVLHDNAIPQPRRSCCGTHTHVMMVSLGCSLCSYEYDASAEQQRAEPEPAAVAASPAAVPGPAAGGSTSRGSSRRPVGNVQEQLVPRIGRGGSTAPTADAVTQSDACLDSALELAYEYKSEPGLQWLGINVQGAALVSER